MTFLQPSRTCPLLPELNRRILVMGVLNVTPDSFSDGGLFGSKQAALDHGLAMAAQGADIIDIGGESTRPGAKAVSIADELDRVIPVVSGLAALTSTPISIDTHKSVTARAALEAGARMLNDVGGLRNDPEIANVAAAFDAPIVIMHNRFEEDPTCDIISDLCRFFEVSLRIARKAGIPDHNIILDPGFGFGKTLQQHFTILLRMQELKALGFPILVGISRKRMIGQIVNRPPQERMAGTLAIHTLAAANGADIIRVHDVAEHFDAAHAVDMYNHYRKESVSS